MGPEGRIRIDANGGWNVDEAEHAIHALAPFDLEYVEQPCAEVEKLAQLRERIAYLDIPIAADESDRKADDPQLGRVSCRARVCKYVKNMEVAATLTKKQVNLSNNTPKNINNQHYNIIIFC